MIKEIIRNSCLRIPFSLEKEQWVSSIIEDLTRSQPVYNSLNGEVEIKNYYSVDDKNFLIPRFYDLGINGDVRIKDSLDSGKNIQISLRGKPKNKRQIDAINWMVTNDNGVLCLSPGEGKTFISIASICKIKKKTLIFAHKRPLITQWIDRILSFTDLKREDIGWLTSKNFKTELDNPIVLSTVQTFVSLIKSKEFLNCINKKEFGMAIWDEAHISSSAEQFSLTSLHTPTKRVYGLSATPERLDGNTDIIFKHLGEVYTPDGDSDTMNPKIIMCYFDHNVVTETSSRYIRWGGRFNRSRYLKKLCKSEKYIQYIQKIIQKLNTSNRRMLFLSDRIDILDSASEIIKNKNDIGFFIPRSKNERQNALTKKNVFSTYGSARDGTDVKEFDALVMATPTSNIEQCVGRVVRILAGKKQPVVIDLIDTGCKEIQGRSVNRKKFYDSKKWLVVEQHWN